MIVPVVVPFVAAIVVYILSLYIYTLYSEFPYTNWYTEAVLEAGSVGFIYGTVFFDKIPSRGIDEYSTKHVKMLSSVFLLISNMLACILFLLYVREDADLLILSYDAHISQLPLSFAC